MIRKILSVLLLLIPMAIYGQGTLEQWTEADGRLGLGFPVPVPVDTDLPFDGFRTYAGLHARHQDLMANSSNIHGIEIGATRSGRPIWAYRLGDEDLETVTGLPEGAMLTNGGIHAREWQTPEVVTGIMELFFAKQGDQYFYDYLLDNANVILIPVLNIDGFMQTQRSPNLSWMDTDPDCPSSCPRDGRMRRKNMLSADEVMQTENDHLNGVDLNRNNPPFWATSPNNSSPNLNSIVHHGAAPHSEPETRALAAAPLLGPEQQLRMYTDVHSFSQVFFWSRTANTRLSNNTVRLFHTFSNHEAALPNGKFYAFSNNINAGIGTGIGATDSFFAHTYQVPSWTLEVEPTNGQSFFPQWPGCSADYGGLANNCHDGFILPESEIRRVRENLAQTFAAAYYQQAGPPALSAVRLVDEETQAVVFEAEWDVVEDDQRMLYSNQLQPLQLERHYTFWVAYDKPMRWRVDGQVTVLPGQPASTLNFNASLVVSGEPLTAIVNTQDWLDELGDAPAGYYHYQDDAAAVSFRLPANLLNTTTVVGTVDSVLNTSTFDMTGLQTDANPATPAKWVDGGWAAYEDSNGVSGGDSGGTDSTIRIQVTSDTLQAPFTIEPGISAAWYDPSRRGEGFVIEILPDGRSVMYWFTYDDEGKQAWYIGVGEVRGNRLIFPELIQTSGGRFGPDFDPDEVERTVVGSATFLYESCAAGTMSYEIGNRKGRFDLSRLSRVMGPQCGGFLGPPFREELIQSGSWYDPDQSGHGFTVEVLADSRILVYWFSYDTEGNQAWFFGTGEIVGQELVIDEMFITQGPFFGPAFDPDALELIPWGETRFSLGCNNGQMIYSSVIEEFGSGNLELSRLSTLSGAECQ